VPARQAGQCEVLQHQHRSAHGDLGRDGLERAVEDLGDASGGTRRGDQLGVEAAAPPGHVDAFGQRRGIGGQARGPSTVASAAGPHWCSSWGWNGTSTSVPRAARRGVGCSDLREDVGDADELEDDQRDEQDADQREAVVAPSTAGYSMIAACASGSETGTRASDAVIVTIARRSRDRGHDVFPR
jgi:hypothetical protein